ncbi:MAG: aminotransferase class III-fold pyridoxal phosphate-dependent enzyme [Bacteriovoracaceae bacterium]|nr:aminotransferase class III-fold pyridoxal phosphate-dependent enzyme [Bacteriovoracaceae bacterium]
MATKSTELYRDPRIEKAKQLLKEAMLDHSSKLTEVKPANPELKDEYQQLLKSFGENRGGALFYNYLGSGIGNGPLVELADGSVKYDFITGIGVHYFGHNHTGLMSALVDSALANTTMHGHLQQNVDSAKLVDLIVSQAVKNGAKLKHCLLASSGAMACENALKMAFQKRYPAHRVLAFERCFMGRTLALAQITDKAAYREGLPQTLAVDYIPFYNPEDHAGSIKNTVAVLKSHIKHRPKEYAAMCMELIQGEAGSFPGHTEFFKAIIDVCKENNITVMVDEVQTFMRTEELYAFQYFKLDKEVDIVTIGKNSQVCATLFGEDHKPRPGLISQTFTSSTAAISAGYYIINEVLEKEYLGKNGKINHFHQYFKAKLEQLTKKYPDKIKGPYGIGAMVGMTLFNGDADKSKAFTMKLFDNGVMSFIAGSAPTRVRFLMPIGAIKEKHIDDVCVILEKTLNEMN